MKTACSQFGSSNRIDFIPTPYRAHRKMTTRDENVEFAKLALHAKRWDDMMNYMGAAAAYTCELSREEVGGFRFATPTEDQLSF